MNWIVNITLICISQDGADVIIGAFAGNEKRNKLMDFTPAVTKGGMALVIPRPTIQQTNIFTTIWRPFQPQVDIKITQFSFVLWIYTSIQWDYLFFGLVRFDSFDADRYIESLRTDSVYFCFSNTVQCAEKWCRNDQIETSDYFHFWINCWTRYLFRSYIHRCAFNWLLL